MTAGPIGAVQSLTISLQDPTQQNNKGVANSQSNENLFNSHLHDVINSQLQIKLQLIINTNYEANQMIQSSCKSTCDFSRMRINLILIHMMS